MNRILRRLSTSFVLALAAVSMTAMAALATPSAGVTAVNDAVTEAAADASSVVTTGIPIILGVALLWVVLKFGKRLLAKI